MPLNLKNTNIVLVESPIELGRWIMTSKKILTKNHNSEIIKEPLRVA